MPGERYDFSRLPETYNDINHAGLVYRGTMRYSDYLALLNLIGPSLVTRRPWNNSPKHREYMRKLIETVGGQPPIAPQGDHNGSKKDRRETE